MIQFDGRSFSDFYKPSDEMKEYQYVVIGVVGLGAGFLVYKIV